MVGPLAASSPEWNSHPDKENVIVPKPVEVMPPNAKNKWRRNLSPGRTCHQCRQQTNNFAMACKAYRNKGRKRPCLIRYCCRCLLNRYGEADLTEQEDWNCPKCRGICNCSCCRRKKGETPTGSLVHIAKATGCTSAHDLLQKWPEAVAAAKALRSTSPKGRKRVKETNASANVFQDEGHENMVTCLSAIPFVPTKKRTKRYIVNNNFFDGKSPLQRDESPNALNNIVQPNGPPAANISGAQLADEDVTMGANLLMFL